MHEVKFKICYYERQQQWFLDKNRKKTLWYIENLSVSSGIDAVLILDLGVVEGLGEHTAFLLLIFLYQHIEFINKVLFKFVLSSFFLFSSVQFSHSVMFDSLRPRGLQHARLPCPSPTAGVYSNSCPLSRWCHPTISSWSPSNPSNFQSISVSLSGVQTAEILSWPRVLTLVQEIQSLYM